MSFGTRAAASLLAVAAVMGVAGAGASETIEHSTNYVDPTLPFTISYGQSYVFPQAPDGRFVDDYGFTVGDVSFSSLVATFDLGATLAIGGLEMRLFAGDPWSGALPATLSAANDALRTSGTVALGTGSAMLQSIGPLTLAPGHYVLEISGLVAGSYGGSYGGVLNLVPVPEAPAGVMALTGLALLGFARRRRRF